MAVAQTQSWKVKRSNRLIFVLAFFVILLFEPFFSPFIRLPLQNGQSGAEEVAFSEIVLAIVILFPILFALALIPISWIFQKKIPNRIELNTTDSIFHLFLKKKNRKSFHLSSLAFEYEEHSLYSVLILYRKSRATRGHYNYFRILSIVALPFGFSWKIADLTEISTNLKMVGVEEYKDGKDMTFMEHITGDEIK